MNKHVVCPHCGFTYSEIDEAFMPGSLTLADSFDEECVECKVPFIVIRDVRAIYHTEKKEVPS